MDKTIEICSYSELRANLKEWLDTANDSRVPILIRRRKGRNAVLIDEDEWNSIAETMHLLSSPANAARLREAVGVADRGKFVAFDPPE